VTGFHGGTSGEEANGLHLATPARGEGVVLLVEDETVRTTGLEQAKTTLPTATTVASWPCT